MEVSLIVGQTYTTVSGGHPMNADLSCMIQNEPIAVRAYPSAEQACLLEPVTDLFRRVQWPFAAHLLDAIDLTGDLSNKNLVFALVTQGERHADSERSQFIEAFCGLLLGMRREQ